MQKKLSLSLFFAAMLVMASGCALLQNIQKQLGPGPRYEKAVNERCIIPLQNRTLETKTRKGKDGKDVEYSYTDYNWVRNFFGYTGCVELDVPKGVSEAAVTVHNDAVIKVLKQLIVDEKVRRWDLFTAESPWERMGNTCSLDEKKRTEAVDRLFVSSDSPSYSLDKLKDKDHFPKAVLDELREKLKQQRQTTYDLAKACSLKKLKDARAHKNFLPKKDQREWEKLVRDRFKAYYPNEKIIRVVFPYRWETKRYDEWQDNRKVYVHFKFSFAVVYVEEADYISGYKVEIQINHMDNDNKRMYFDGKERYLEHHILKNNFK